MNSQLRGMRLLLIITTLALGTSLSLAEAVSSRQTGIWGSSATWSTWLTRAAKTGTITVTTGSAAVTGTSTLFTTELAVGNVLEDLSGNILGTILTITDDANLTLSATATVDYSGSYYTQRIPLLTDDVTINGSDSVHISPAAAVCHSITIKSGARLKTTMNLEGGTGGVSAGGTFTIESNATLYQDRNSGNKWPQLFATYSIHSNSNYVVNSTGTPPSSICSAPPAEYGNLIINRSGAVLIAAPAITSVNIKGNLVANSGSGGSFKLTNNKSSAFSTIHVGGNIYVTSGILGAVDAVVATTTAVVTVDGSVIVGDASTASGVAALACFSAADASQQRIGVYNIHGNLSYINGAKCEAGTSTTSLGTTEVGIINLYGNLSTDATIVMATNTLGSFAMNFVGTGTQTITLGTRMRFASTAMLMTMYDTVAATSSVVFAGPGYSWSSNTTGAFGGGEWVVNGSLALRAVDTIKGVQAFTLNSGATLAVGHAAGIEATGVAGSIQVTGTRTFSTGANYVYNGSTAQITGDGLPATVNILTINNIGGVTTNPNSVSVSNTLNLLAGLLEHTVHPVTPLGSVFCGGGFSNPDLGCGTGGGSTDIAMAKGWNLVCCPRVQTSYAAGDVFPGALGSLFKYDPNIGDYAEAPEVPLGMGVWVYYTGATTISVVGSSPASIVIACKKGWNMIGGRETPVAPGSLTVDAGMILGSLFKYAPSIGDYAEITGNLEPGMGAWVYVTANCNLTVP